MAIVTHPPSTIPVLIVSRLHHKHLNLRKSLHPLSQSYFPCISTNHNTFCRANKSPWEPAPVTYASDTEEPLLMESTNIYDTMASSSNEPTQDSEPLIQNQYLRWPLWFLGPALLLATGVVPTLWLPISSIFLGPNIASLLSLTGLDCIFNIGASLFLLIADSTARSKSKNEPCISKPPISYQFWNMLANLLGFAIPLAMFLVSQKGYIQPQFPFISYLVLLGPYFLLLSVQMLTEMLTWHWESPVWLVTPVVYESYRLLQLMRGLKLGVELNAPSWMVHTVRGLVCGWVLVLGVQLMRVVWYAGFTARAYRQESVPSVDGD